MHLPQLTLRENELLQRIVDWLSTHYQEEAVPHQWLQQQLGVGKSGVSDLKRQLILKRYLKKDRNNFLLTDQALASLRTLSNRASQLNITPSQLPLRGMVKGGRAAQGEIEIDLKDFVDENASTIPIPFIQSMENVFALQVVGSSMEHENIYQNDYVIVEGFTENEWPKQGELIITKYLAPKDELYVEGATPSSASQGSVPDDVLEGPTVKFYFDKADEERPYRLSWRKDVYQSPYTIVTKYIVPIGRVIGVYHVVGRRSSS